MPLELSIGCSARNLPGEVDVDAQKSMNSQAESISAAGGLELAEHGRGVQLGATGRRKLGGLEQDGCPVVEGQLAPEQGRCLGGVDGDLRSPTVALRIVPSTLRLAWGWRTSSSCPSP